MELIEKELTYAIKGCFFEVQNEVGLGMEEEAYHEAMIKALGDKGLRFESKLPIWVPYRGRDVVEFIPDFIIGDRVVVEIKALREGFAQEHFVQLFSYLKATRLPVGFLVNFGLEWIHDERMVFTEKPFELEEEWGEVKGLIGDENRTQLALVRDALIEVGQTYGFGYGELTYRRLVTAAGLARAQTVTWKPLAQPHFRERSLGQFETQCFLMGERIVCVLMALKDGLHQFDIGRTRTYLKHFGLSVGVVANFGKDRLQLMGIRNETGRLR